MRTKETKEIARVWSKPQFFGIDGLTEAIARTEDAEFAPVEVRGRVMPHRIAVVGKDSGNAYGICSHRYAIVQNQELFLSLALALQEFGAEVEGSVLSADGETKLVLQVGNPLNLEDSEYRFMIIAKNSYNGEVAWGGMSALMRLLCSNGMMALKGVCANFSQKHTMGLEERIAEWGNFLELASQGTEQLEPTIRSAGAEIVPNMEYVLRGAGFGPRIVAKVIDSFDRLVPEAQYRAATKWDVYNAMTNYYSNRPKGDWKTNVAGIEQAGRMLATPMAELLVRGQEALTVVATP